MNAKKASQSLIIILLVAAADIIISSSLLDGTGSSQTAMFLIVAVWFVPFTWLAAQSGNKNREKSKIKTIRWLTYHTS